MKAGDVDSLIDAAYNAREVSVDFGMHGHNAALRMLTRITPFLNPALIGWYKAANTSREQFFPLMLRGSILAAFSVGLFLLNKDKEWYDELEQWEKNIYWIFDVGLRDEAGAVIPLRVPKPFEWGAVFGSVPEALTQVAIDKNGGKFGKRLASIFNDVFGLRVVPTSVLVPAEIWANKNTFTGRKIVPESKERLDSELQYGATTSLTARELGRLTDTSPAQIDHGIRGFLGTMGVYSVMLADQGVRALGDYPEPPESTWRQMPVVKAFVHDPANPNSHYINEFYQLLDKSRRASATFNKLSPDRQDDYYAKHGEEIDRAAEINEVAREIADLRKDSEQIRDSRELSGKEKTELINQNALSIRRLSKQFMRESATTP